LVQFGEEHVDYQKKVPRMIAWKGRQCPGPTKRKKYLNYFASRF